MYKIEIAQKNNWVPGVEQGKQNLLSTRLQHITSYSNELTEVMQKKTIE